MISKELYEFLKAWRNWVDLGATDWGPFSRCNGLCGCILGHYCAKPSLASECRAEIKTLLYKDFGDSMYPFGEVNYDIRVIQHTQHEDPARLAWVDKKIKEYEDAQK